MCRRLLRFAVAVAVLPPTLRRPRDRAPELPRHVPELLRARVAQKLGAQSEPLGPRARGVDVVDVVERIPVEVRRGCAEPPADDVQRDAVGVNLVGSVFTVGPSHAYSRLAVTLGCAD